MTRTFERLSERLLRVVKYENPDGPKCLWWRIVRPSGPGAMKFEVFQMASETREGENRSRL